MKIKLKLNKINNILKKRNNIKKKNKQDIDIYIKKYQNSVVNFIHEKLKNSDFVKKRDLLLFLLLYVTGLNIDLLLNLKIYHIESFFHEEGFVIEKQQNLVVSNITDINLKQFSILFKSFLNENEEYLVFTSSKNKGKPLSKYNIEKSINIIINDINAQYNIHITMNRLKNQVYFTNFINKNN